MPSIPPAPIDMPPQTTMRSRDPDLWRLSQSLESTFLAEMLGSAGLGETSDEFGGGIGEDQFSSFLNQQRAAAMVEKGGIGLAESIYRSLVGRTDSLDGR